MKTAKDKSVNNHQNTQTHSAGVSSYDGQVFDIMLHAWASRYIGYISPASFGLAMYDWLAHAAFSPAKNRDLTRKGWHELICLLLFYAHAQCSNISNPSCSPNISKDKRFKNDAWQQFPFNMYAESFLTIQRLCDDATTNVRGVSRHHMDVVNFTVRQILDMLSPSNFPGTNPEVISQYIATGGTNFVDGFNNFIEDATRNFNNQPLVGTEKFKVGENVAVTPGKVIFRNRLIELIQYEPTTKKVFAEPVLIIPAWIMKYYILDLSPHNSLVKYLVDKGHTVFMISWKNPDSEDRDLSLEDYMNLGIMDGLAAVNRICPGQAVHAAGYCLGGTLLMIAAAVMGRDSDTRFESITLFAAQVDFKEPGELSLFIDSSQVSYLEDIMWEKGYLDGPAMSNAFSMLHSNDLIWSRMIHDYLFGKRRSLNDLMAWDMDTTRLPYRMHSQYLHSLFLNNDLTGGRFKINRKKIALPDIKQPIFAVGTVKDHVSPWKSVYKIHLFTDTEFTFVLTNGGHNAGIVNEPGHKGRCYQINTRQVGEKHINSETWQERMPVHKGSWWPAWEKWLAERSGEKVIPPSMGNPKKDEPVLCDAPGTYVYQK